MKRSLISSALALALSISALPLHAAQTAPNSWDALQPDREQVIASLNVVELLKREALAVGPKINPFDVTLRRPAQSLSSVRPDQAIQPAGQEQK